jgi:hypothetical protein
MHQVDLGADVGQVQRLSTAVLPPPITATSWPRKKKPSQVAQADTPLPMKRFSDSMPRYLALAPVVMISASQVYSPLSPLSRNGRGELGGVDLVEHDLGLEALGVREHARHQVRAHQAVRVAGPVVDFGGGHELAALLQAGDQHGLRLARAA